MIIGLLANQAHIYFLAATLPFIAVISGTQMVIADAPIDFMRRGQGVSRAEPSRLMHF
jgi:hypothetical protein